MNLHRKAMKLILIFRNKADRLTDSKFSQPLSND